MVEAGPKASVSSSLMGKWRFQVEGQAGYSLEQLHPAQPKLHSGDRVQGFGWQGFHGVLDGNFTPDASSPKSSHRDVQVETRQAAVVPSPISPANSILAHGQDPH